MEQLSEYLDREHAILLNDVVKYCSVQEDEQRLFVISCGSTKEEVLKYLGENLKNKDLKCRCMSMANCKYVVRTHKPVSYPPGFMEEEFNPDEYMGKHLALDYALTVYKCIKDMHTVGAVTHALSILRICPELMERLGYCTILFSYLRLSEKNEPKYIEEDMFVRNIIEQYQLGVYKISERDDVVMKVISKYWHNVRIQVFSMLTLLRDIFSKADTGVMRCIQVCIDLRKCMGEK